MFFMYEELWRRIPAYIIFIYMRANNMIKIWNQHGILLAVQAVKNTRNKFLFYTGPHFS